MCTKPIFKVKDLLTQDRKTGRAKEFFAQTTNELDARAIYKPPRYTVQLLPCGSCMECRLQKASENAFRCLKETQEYKDNIMLTLTYNEQNVPKTQYIDLETGEVNETTTLKVKDIQDFKKRLRKHFSGVKIRTAECGEYGEQKERPHYHMIIMNLKVPDMKFYKWSKCEWSNEKNPLYKSKIIDKIWGKGFVDLNEVNYETCKYVCGYVTKKYKGRLAKEKYEGTNRVPPFYHTSKGFAKNFYIKNKEAIFNGEKIWQKTKKGTKEVKLGRYFDKLMEADDPEKYEKLKKERRKRSLEMLEETLRNTSLNCDEYRAQLDFIKEKRTQILKRQKL